MAFDGIALQRPGLYPGRNWKENWRSTGWRDLHSSHERRTRFIIQIMNRSLRALFSAKIINRYAHGCYPVEKSPFPIKIYEEPLFLVYSPGGGGGGEEGASGPELIPSSLPPPPATAATATPPTITASPRRIRPVRPASSLHASGLIQERLPPVATGDFQREGETSATKSPTEENSTPISAYCSYSVDRPDATIFGPRGPLAPPVEAHPEIKAVHKKPLIIFIASIVFSPCFSWS